MNEYQFGKVEKCFFKYVRSKDEENQFHGIWHHRLYITTAVDIQEKDIFDNAVSNLTGILSNFLSKWKQVIINKDEMNYEFDKNPIIYLIKMDQIFGRVKIIDVENRTFAKRFSRAMNKRKRLNWFSQPYFRSKIGLAVTLAQSWRSFFALTMKYLPTIKCSHCSLSTFELQEQCPACYKIYNIADPPLGEEDTWIFEEMNHILELCFDHRKKLVIDCADSLIVKLIGEKAVGANTFVDISKYGFQ